MRGLGTFIIMNKKISALDEYARVPKKSCSAGCDPQSHN